MTISSVANYHVSICLPPSGQIPLVARSFNESTLLFACSLKHLPVTAAEWRHGRKLKAMICNRTTALPHFRTAARSAADAEEETKTVGRPVLRSTNPPGFSRQWST